MRLKEMMKTLRLPTALNFVCIDYQSNAFIERDELAVVYRPTRAWQLYFVTMAKYLLRPK